jgi:hypothetical protein
LNKKPYIKPKVNSVKIEEPKARAACTVHNASGTAGSWSGNIQEGPINWDC